MLQKVVTKQIAPVEIHEGLAQVVVVLQETHRILYRDETIDYGVYQMYYVIYGILLTVHFADFSE